MRLRVVESNDADEFATLIEPDGCDILVTECGSFKARGTLTNIGRLFLQQGHENLSRLIEVTSPRSGVVFLPSRGQVYS